MENSYYNTTQERGEMLRKFEVQACSQEAKLYNYFKKHHRSELTRTELHRVVLRNAPVSSICRALANLKAVDLIERTDEKRNGEYGRPQFLWRFVKHLGEQTEMFSTGNQQ